ncbi:transcriptional regulator, LuxR family [Alloactinosynnema sp. L-07]|uniref:helix-turn-helix transcriptional regulator n=1 Tax=Alloactinosynnema sp. L-07 TaxID=1653480 RepID=UPI00065EF5E0|nr:response regulator transcription factor [Alloactinosynnema sp. L-07]CRK57306.1 transcriptional regulator, LuxR family [Alloactinosynnema sp. L-07]
MGEPVRVDVVALDPLLEAGVTSALHGCPDVEVARVGEPAAVTVVIVDGVGHDVLDLVRSIRAREPRPEVVLVATDLAAAEALHVIAVGARGLLRRREASAARLARTVLAAAAGDCTVPPDMLDRLLEHSADPLSATRAEWTGPGLSDRERAVLALVADGHETGEIAKELSYSTRTVAGVVHDITHRFRLRNRAHAVAYALRAGLL